MYDLLQKEQLWGWLPFFFFLSIWLSIVFVFWKKYTRHPKGLRWLGLSTLSGVLLSLGFPPLPFMFVLFVAWVPLLIVEHEVSQEKEKVSLLPYAYNTFALWNILVTWWVGNTAFIAGFFAFFINALFMCAPFLLFHKTKKVIPNLAYSAFAVYWMSFEMLHLNWEASWSWLNLGNAFGQLPSWVQWYEYTGIFGGSLWVLLLNVLIFKLLAKHNFKASFKNICQDNAGGVIKIIIIGTLPILISFGMYFSQEDKGSEVEVVVVQPNFEPHFEKFNIPKDQQITRFIQLAEEQITDKTEYLVFPETSFNGGETSGIEGNLHIRRLKRFLSKYPNLKLVTGVNAYKIFRPDEPHTNSTREDKRDDGSSVFWEAYNASVQISNNDSLQFYIKGKLVPGAEILPYNRFLFFLKPVADALGGSLEGHGRSTVRKTFDSNSGKIAPVICYESIFGDYHRGYIIEGAEAIFVVTNDGWWDNSPGFRQHLTFSVLRAIETRRSIARSANVGTTCFINQRGDISQPSTYNKASAVRQTIRFNNEQTFYVKWGDLIGRIAVFLTTALLLNTVAKSLKKD